jgi:hypothetical protein
MQIKSKAKAVLSKIVSFYIQIFHLTELTICCGVERIRVICINGKGQE